MGRRKPALVERNRQQKRRLHEFLQEEQLPNGLMQLSNGSIGHSDEEEPLVDKKPTKVQATTVTKSLQGVGSKPLKLSFRDAWTLWQEDAQEEADKKLKRSLWFSTKCCRKTHWAGQPRERMGMVRDAHRCRAMMVLVNADNEPLKPPTPASSDEDLMEVKWSEVLQPTDALASDSEHVVFPDSAWNLLEHAILELVREEMLVMFWDPVEPDDEETQWVLTIALDWHQYRVRCDQQSLDAVPRHRTLPKSMQHVMTWLLITCHGGNTFSNQNSRTSIGPDCGWNYPYPEEIPALLAAQLNPGRAFDHSNSEFDFAELYKYMEQYHEQLARQPQENEGKVNSAADNVNLLVSLRKYQQEAVDWMISREQTNRPDLQPVTQLASSACRACCTHVELVCRQTGEIISYYDLLTTRFYDAKGNETPSEFQPFAIKGGILADEMGLGKTVEVIALVVTHPASADFLKASVTFPIGMNTSRRSDKDSDKDSLACVCGSDEDHSDGWVQCDYCGTWHHQVCVGWDAQEHQTFRCFHCYYHHLELSRGSVPCKTTLIVSPESIHVQWEQELRRHVRPRCLRVVRYEGVHSIRTQLDKHRKPNQAWQLVVNPCKWNDADVVLTTYETLTRDLGFVADQLLVERRQSTRQKKKRYAFILSPLMVLQFWRVCMDEAQVGVENAQLRASLMANHLSCMNRWIVTGTPFSSQWKDLYGSLKFLQIAPFHDEKSFEQLLMAPRQARASLGYQRLLDLLVFATNREQLMWRTQKKHILDQLQLPVQTHQTVLCRFSEVEQHFYQQQQQKVVRMLQQARQHYDDEATTCLQPLHGREDQLVSNLWRHLLVLRQICCHPQVGNQLQRLNEPGAGSSHHHLAGGSSASRRSGTGARRKRAKRFGPGGTKLAPLDQTKPMYLTMDDFLMELIAKNKLDCEEAQRKFIAAQNALCGLLVLRQELEPAIIKYLATIEMIRANWNHFRADLLPRLHLLENLARIVREFYQLPARATSTAASMGMVVTRESEGDATNCQQRDQEDQISADHSANPKEVCMLPSLRSLKRYIGAPLSEEILPEIEQECAALEQNGQTIKQFYLSQNELSHLAALGAFESLWNSNGQLIRPSQRFKSSQLLLTREAGKWWFQALELIELSSSDSEELFIDKLQAKLMTTGSKWALDFCQKFRAISGFRLCLVQELEALAAKRSSIYKKLMDMSRDKPTKRQILVSGNCRKCRDGRDGPVCPHCLLYQQMENYRMHLLGMDAHFGMNVKSSKSRFGGGMNDIYEEEDVWQSSTTNNTIATGSLVLEVFKEVAHFTKALLKKNKHHTAGAMSTTELDAGLHHESEFFGALVKEWNAAKRLLQVQHQRLGALDELEMALMQIRVRQEDEVIEPNEASYKIEVFEIDAKMHMFQLEKAVAEREMREKHAQLRYLFNLKAPTQLATVGQAKLAERSNQVHQSLDTTQSSNDGDVENDDGNCLICLEPMQGERAVLASCAHSFCKQCMETLTHQRTSSGSLGPVKTSIKCPSCRRLCSVQEIRVVQENCLLATPSAHEAPKQKGTHTQGKSDEDIQLKAAGHGTKIDAVARRLLQLAKQKPGVKAILFTQWQDMLSLLAWALGRNGMTCFCYSTKRKLGKVIQEFKLCTEPCVLLLPFKIGANGLNLVEASEVFLIEPLLSTNLESQAINRVHRIGQTQRTRVHRFIVSDSVEERILELHKKKTRKARASHGHSDHLMDVSAGAQPQPPPILADTGGDIEVDGDDEEDEEELSLVTKNDREDLTLKDLSDLLQETRPVDSNQPEPMEPRDSDQMRFSMSRNGL